MPESSQQTTLIDRQSELMGLCEQLKDRVLIGCDTEFNRTQTYRPQLCLVQLDMPGGAACVDVLAGLDLEPLLTVLGRAELQKVFHAAKQDMEAMQLTFGVLPGPLFDTQIAAGLIGYAPQIGYANLVEAVLGVSLGKSETRTDWARRPLSAAQLDYAGDDVHYLQPLHEALSKRLVDAGRLEWAIEDSATLLEPGQYEAAPEKAWARIASIAYLPVPAQARARSLAAWREARASQVDRPRQWIMSDKALLAIAQANPGDERSLARVSELPPGAIRSQGRRILDELQAANDAVARHDIDFQQQTKPLPPDAQRLKALGRQAKAIAEELDIAPELLVTRRELTALLRGRTDVRVMTGWRREAAGEALLAECSAG